MIEAPSKSEIPSPKFIAGLDLGGTEIKCGAFDENGQLVAKCIMPTRDGEMVDDHPAFVSEVKRGLHELSQQLNQGFDRVGLAAPGLAARGETCIAFMPGRLRGIEGLNWATALGISNKVPVLNDAHAALLGEVWQGAARNRQHVVLLTLGTGVGGAIMVDGKLLKGEIGRAGHLGHMTVDHHGPPTITGTPGGIELAIGNATLSERTGGRFTMTRDLATAAQSGDTFAQRIWRDSVHALAAHIAGLICALDPECIVIGGGLSELDGFLFDPLVEFLDSFEWRPNGHRVPIAKAALGSWAGAYGAAYYTTTLP
ncbi:MAG: ROK family protein [Verrucomicrobiales bacterium]